MEHSPTEGREKRSWAEEGVVSVRGRGGGGGLCLRGLGGRMRLWVRSRVRMRCERQGEA